MDEVRLKLNEDGHGAFYIMKDEEQWGEMVFSITGDILTVYHTEVSAKAEGTGMAKKLLDAMVAYCRKNSFKVVALCPYVHAAFKRHAEQYIDIWKREVEEKR